MAALVVFGSVVFTVSLVMSLYAIIRIEVHVRTKEQPDMVQVPSSQLFTSTKDIYKQEEDADDRYVTPDDVFAGDLEFREIP